MRKSSHVVLPKDKDRGYNQILTVLDLDDFVFRIYVNKITKRTNIYLYVLFGL